MSARWRWFLPGYLWALPHTLVGLLLALTFYRCHSWRWHQGVLACIADSYQRTSINPKNGKPYTYEQSRIWGGPGAQTHGWLMIAASEREFARADLRVHEFTHVVQAFIGGPLYALAYGLTFAWYWTGNVLFGGPLTKWLARAKDWHAAYLKIPFERHAYHVGDQAKGWGA